MSDIPLLRQKNFVDGAWIEADSGTTLEVRNPATGELIGTVPRTGTAEVRCAIDAAARALPLWRALTAKQRAQRLRRWFELIMQNQEDLARLMTLEQGKPLAEARSEMPMAPPSWSGLPKRASACTAT